MNDYFVLIGFVIVLLAYLFYFKEKLIKWGDRTQMGKSYSINFIIILVAGIVLLSIKIFKSQ